MDLTETRRHGEVLTVVLCLRLMRTVAFCFQSYALSGLLISLSGNREEVATAVRQF